MWLLKNDIIKHDMYIRKCKKCIEMHIHTRMLIKLFKVRSIAGVVCK